MTAQVTRRGALDMQVCVPADWQRQHILLGHRSLQSSLNAIQATIEDPTHIYRSKTDDNRLVFVSRDVVIGKERPMKVIIERTGEHGKVITATWSGPHFSEQLIWDSSGTLYTNYDAQHDVFYISKGTSAPEYAEDDPESDNVWLRRNNENDTPQGVTVFGLKKLPVEEREPLFRRIASFLGATKDEVELRANVAFKA